jgi:hypothetical protein
VPSVETARYGVGEPGEKLPLSTRWRQRVRVHVPGNVERGVRDPPRSGEMTDPCGREALLETREKMQSLEDPLAEAVEGRNPPIRKRVEDHRPVDVHVVGLGRVLPIEKHGFERA